MYHSGRIGRPVSETSPSETSLSEISRVPREHVRLHRFRFIFNTAHVKRETITKGAFNVAFRSSTRSVEPPGRISRVTCRPPVAGRILIRSKDGHAWVHPRVAAAPLAIPCHPSPIVILSAGRCPLSWPHVRSSQHWS